MYKSCVLRTREKNRTEENKIQETQIIIHLYSIIRLDENMSSKETKFHHNHHIFFSIYFSLVLYFTLVVVVIIIGNENEHTRKIHYYWKHIHTPFHEL